MVLYDHSLQILSLSVNCVKSNNPCTKFPTEQVNRHILEILTEPKKDFRAASHASMPWTDQDSVLNEDETSAILDKMYQGNAILLEYLACPANSVLVPGNLSTCECVEGYFLVKAATNI